MYAKGFGQFNIRKSNLRKLTSFGKLLEKKQSSLLRMYSISKPVVDIKMRMVTSYSDELLNQELDEEKLDELKKMKDLQSYKEVQDVSAKIKHSGVEGGFPNFLSVFESQSLCEFGPKKGREQGCPERCHNH